MKLITHLLKSVRAAAIYNPDLQVAPACILWPDRDRQWETALPQLRTELPELLTLGDYAPEQRTGPAIWLRCVIAGTTGDCTLPAKSTPILYLPGVSRQELRAVAECPDGLKPLAELQYRGVIWSQANARDWTILAWLKSDQGGLGLDVAHQEPSLRQAMQLALYRLLDEELELLQGKHLDRDYFNTLLTGGDPVRDVLQWLDQGDAFRASRGPNEWKAFVEVCQSRLAFNPQHKGILDGAAKLATHEGPWNSVWERFCEAPTRYTTIPDRIRSCRPPSDTIFWHSDDVAFDGWPQWNEDQEKSLRQELLALASIPAHTARIRLQELEQQHGRRRGMVWATLGEAPLAHALEHLATMAAGTTAGLATGTLDDLATGYCTSGWQVDDGMVRALAQIDRSPDLAAVTAAIRAVYLPWAEASAQHLQQLADGTAWPGDTGRTSTPDTGLPGDCILFVDGLRFDTGKRLAGLLEDAGYAVTAQPVWTALPSVTATGKAAVTPVRDRLTGPEGSTDFEPMVAATGQSLKGGYPLKKLLAEAGWTILDRTAHGTGQGKAWGEFGDIDHEGHDRGWKLARHLPPLLNEIRDRVVALLQAGWTRVHVVTDHGWLLLPGGLPTVELPAALTDSKWGRCAALKPGATTTARLYPWHWNPAHCFVLANGVGCFRNGEAYAHGGISLQECLTLHLTVLPDTGHAPPGPAVEIVSVVWKRLRCTVVIDGNGAGLFLDIRTRAGEAASSIAHTVKPFHDHESVSVIVGNDELEGEEAMVVLVDAGGTPVAQIITVIGGGKG
jgi:hypothetical protein